MDSDAHSITVDVEVVSICTQAEAEKGAGKGHEGDEPTPVFDPTLNKRDQTGIGYANANLANQSNTNNNNNHTNDGNSKSANGRNAPEEGAQPGNKVKPVFYYENNTNELFKASGEIFNIKVRHTYYTCSETCTRVIKCIHAWACASLHAWCGAYAYVHLQS